jgi:hypothetical protein
MPFLNGWEACPVHALASDLATTTGIPPTTMFARVAGNSSLAVKLNAGFKDCSKKWLELQPAANDVELHDGDDDEDTVFRPHGKKDYRMSCNLTSHSNRAGSITLCNTFPSLCSSPMLNQRAGISISGPGKTDLIYTDHVFDMDAPIACVLSGWPCIQNACHNGAGKLPTPALIPQRDFYLFKRYAKSLMKAGIHVSASEEDRESVLMSLTLVLLNWHGAVILEFPDNKLALRMNEAREEASVSLHTIQLLSI